VNTLSAIRAFTSPELQAMRPLNPGLASPQAAPIPASELQALASDATQAIGQAPKTEASFNGVLGQFVQDVNTKQVQAGQAVAGLLGGQDVPLHQAVLSMEEASVSFQLMVEVRNRLLESYQELMRMQV
jgi:flagellar hook-basal body complex protein FliE